MSNAIITVPAGSQVTAEWHHTLAGADPSDSQDPIDPSHHGVFTFRAYIDLMLKFSCRPRHDLPVRYNTYIILLSCIVLNTVFQRAGPQRDANDCDWPPVVQDLGGRLPSLKPELGCGSHDRKQGQGHFHDPVVHPIRPIPHEARAHW